MGRFFLALLILLNMFFVKGEAAIFTPPNFSASGFMPSGGGALWLPQYWFADGFLLSDLQANETYLTSRSGIILYGWPDIRSVATGQVANGAKVRLLSVGCWAWPELMLVGARQEMRLAEREEKMRQFGYISFLEGKGAVVYAQGRNMLLPKEELQGALPNEWGSGERGQWLYVRTENGVSGWSLFSAEQWLATRSGAHLNDFTSGASPLQFALLPELQAVKSR